MCGDRITLPCTFKTTATGKMNQVNLGIGVAPVLGAAKGADIGMPPAVCCGFDLDPEELFFVLGDEVVRATLTPRFADAKSVL